MPTVTKYPTGNTVNQTGWTNPTNAYSANSVYATAQPGNSATYSSYFTTFGFDAAIPSGSTINSVTVEVKWYVSTTASVATLGARVYSGTVAKGTEFTNAAEPTSPVTETFSVTGLTRADLLDGTLKVLIRATKTGSGTSFIGYLDYVSVTVDYTLPVVNVTSVSITNAPTSLELNSTVQLTANVLPSNATDKSVNWSSDNTSVLLVNSSGLVTAVGSGTANITVTTTDGNKTDTKSISVIVSVTGVSISAASTTLELGSTMQLGVNIVPANATNKSVTWSSDNISILTVNSGGLVTAINVGSASITVTTVDGGKTSTIQLTVVISVTGVSLNFKTGNLIIGQTLQLIPTISPDTATNKSVNWSSSNTNVATVSSNGLITAVSNGSAVITVTTNDKSLSDICNLIVSSSAYFNKKLSGLLTFTKINGIMALKINGIS